MNSLVPKDHGLILALGEALRKQNFSQNITG